MDARAARTFGSMFAMAIVERRGVGAGTVNVAVVDDDAGVRSALARLLRAAGFNPVGYSSAEGFLADPGRAQTDCLVLDVHLGGMSGLDLQERITAGGVAPPIIFVTAHEEPDAQERARRAGMRRLLPQTGSRSRAPGGRQAGGRSVNAIRWIRSLTLLRGGVSRVDRPLPEIGQPPGDREGAISEGGLPPGGADPRSHPRRVHAFRDDGPRAGRAESALGAWAGLAFGATARTSRRSGTRDERSRDATGGRRARAARWRRSRARPPTRPASSPSPGRGAP